MLCFIQDCGCESERFIMFKIAAQKRIGCDDQVRRLYVIPKLVSIRSGESQHFEMGDEFLCLGGPVVHEAGGAHDQ